MTNYELFVKVREIFGGIVRDAEVKEALVYINNRGELAVDGGSLVVTFENGKKVEFWTSEWGGINESEE